MRQVPREAAIVIDRGISQWPAEIDAIRVYTDECRYYVDGIFEKKEELSNAFKGLDSAIIQFNLHDAIHEIVHRHAEHGRLLLMKSLPVEEIYTNLMSRLRYAVSEPGLGWEASEITAAREFLDRNGGRREQSGNDIDP